MKRNWFWLIAPWALFIVLAAGWVAYWNIVASTAEQRIQTWIGGVALYQTIKAFVPSIGSTTQT